MALRTDPTMVSEVIQVASGAKLTRHIKWANLIVDRMVACATERGYTHTSDELIEIETNLAAHHYSIRDPQYTSKSTANASGSFSTKEWFHAAMSLDGSGCLAGILGRDGMGAQTAGIDWLGKEPSNQIPYDERD